MFYESNINKKYKNLQFADEWSEEIIDTLKVGKWAKLDVYSYGNSVAHISIYQNITDKIIIIEFIQVLKHHRRKGLGSYMIKKIIETFPGHEFQLTCTPFGLDQIDIYKLYKFYVKNGFKLVDLEYEYYLQNNCVNDFMLFTGINMIYENINKK